MPVRTDPATSPWPPWTAAPPPWIATAPQATLTVQLPKQTSISSATVTRGSTGSFSYRVETSTDGTTGHVIATAPATSSYGVDQFTFAPTQAAYVGLDFPGTRGATDPDIDELTVG